jgi:hypothetical protein
MLNPQRTAPSRNATAAILTLTARKQGPSHYRDLVEGFEEIMTSLLTRTYEAIGGACALDQSAIDWAAPAQELGRDLLRLPHLIFNINGPEEYVTLRSLYIPWASGCTLLGKALLAFLAALDRQDWDAAQLHVNAFIFYRATVDAHTESRAIYLESLHGRPPVLDLIAA